MKKILSVFLVLIMLVLLSTISISAEVDRDALENEFFDYCVSSLNTPDEDTTIVWINEYYESDGVLWFSGGCGWNPIATIMHISNWGDWYSISGLGNSELSVVGIYIKVNNEIYSLEDAWEERIVTDLTPATKLSTCFFYRVGDVNGDKQINVKDATALQKYIASFDMETDVHVRLHSAIFDMNKDDKINIRDATAIQKYLARMDY